MCTHFGMIGPRIEDPLREERQADKGFPERRYSILGSEKGKDTLKMSEPERIGEILKRVFGYLEKIYGGAIPRDLAESPDLLDPPSLSNQFIRRRFFHLALGMIRRDIEREIDSKEFDRGLSGSLDSVVNLQERYGGRSKDLAGGAPIISGPASLSGRESEIERLQG